MFTEKSFRSMRQDFQEHVDNKSCDYGSIPISDGYESHIRLFSYSPNMEYPLACVICDTYGSTVGKVNIGKLAENTNYFEFVAQAREKSIAFLK